jgi:chemotaxis signal transduction protein
MLENKKTTDIHDPSKNRELLEKFIVLEIEHENFIIPLLYVNEIVRVQEVTQAPHQPE